MLGQVKESVEENLEKALYLSREQMQSINSFNFAATGFYGVGKTTALEVAIDKIVENPVRFPHPKIVFVTWDDSTELMQLFEEKFQTIRDKNLPQFTKSDCLEVLSLAEAFRKYGVGDMLNARRRTKPDLISDLCLKLQGELKLMF